MFLLLVDELEFLKQIWGKQLLLKILLVFGYNNFFVLLPADIHNYVFGAFQKAYLIYQLLFALLALQLSLEVNNDIFEQAQELLVNQLGSVIFENDEGFLNILNDHFKLILLVYVRQEVLNRLYVHLLHDSEHVENCSETNGEVREEQL